MKAIIILTADDGSVQVATADQVPPELMQDPMQFANLGEALGAITEAAAPEGGDNEGAEGPAGDSEVAEGEDNGSSQGQMQAPPNAGEDPTTRPPQGGPAGGQEEEGEDDKALSAGYFSAKRGG